MTKTSNAKLKLPDGWTILLTANKYQAMRKSDQFTTELVGEKIDAIKLAIKQEQEDRWNASKARPVTEAADKTHPFDEIPVCLCGHNAERHADGNCDDCVCESYEEADRGADDVAIFQNIQSDTPNTVQDIAITRIQPSPDNPRKHFDETELDELTASIRERGVEIPIAVLPAKAFGMHVIIYGERRWRASQAAGKETIPALVLDISEERADEMRFNENHQRKNLTPLEEAAWFQRRIEIYGKTVQDIAAHSGYSTKTIAKRLRLNSLPETAKEALVEGALCLGSALALARLDDPKQMAEATDVFLRNRWYEYHSDPKKAASYIERTYFTRLDKAPFNVKDVTLLPEAGNCLVCPKRTGNQGDLFDDVKEKDTCLDRKCYDQKCTAHTQRELDKAEAKGLRVLTEQEVKKLAPHGSISGNAEYVSLDDKCWQDDKDRTWKKLLGKDAPEPVVAVIGGEVKHLVPKAEAAEIVNNVHHIKIVIPASQQAKASQEKQNNEMRRIVMKETIIALGAWALAYFRERLTETTPLAFWSCLATMAVKNLRNGGQDYLSKVYELEPEKHPHGLYDYEGALLKKIQSFSSPAHVAAFLVQIIAVDRWHWWTQPGGNDKPHDDHKAMCALIGFDLNAAMKQAKNAATAKTKGKTKTAKAK